MGSRKRDERLVKIWDSGGKTYSISKLNAIHTCPYMAYLTYIKKEEQKYSSVYGILGTRVHDQLEACIHGEADDASVAAAIEDELEDLEIMGMEFPKDRYGRDSIKNNWIANMSRFAKEFKTPKGDFTTEELLIFPIDDKNYLMGYADAIKHNKDGSVMLIDWKTGHNYGAKDVVEAGRQLCVYKKALEEQGYEVKSVCWCMVKYCETTWTVSVRGRRVVKSKVSEWRNLIKDMKSVIERKMSNLGYDSLDIDLYLEKAMEENSFDPLPDDVRNGFKTTIYVRKYDVTDEVMEETLQYVRDTIRLYEELEEKDAAIENEEDKGRDWKPCNIKENSFFCNSLCGYGNKTGQCKYWVDYCNTFSKDDGDDDGLF